MKTKYLFLSILGLILGAVLYGYAWYMMNVRPDIDINIGGGIAYLFGLGLMILSGISFVFYLVLWFFKNRG
jgi:hypothetical protein